MPTNGEMIDQIQEWINTDGERNITVAKKKAQEELPTCTMTTDEAVTILTALGIKKADTMSETQLLKKMNALAETHGDAVIAKKSVQKDFNAILEVLNGGGSITFEQPEEEEQEEEEEEWEDEEGSEEESEEEEWEEEEEGSEDDEEWEEEEEEQEEEEWEEESEEEEEWEEESEDEESEEEEEWEEESDEEEEQESDVDDDSDFEEDEEEDSDFEEEEEPKSRKGKKNMAPAKKTAKKSAPAKKSAKKAPVSRAGGGGKPGVIDVIKENLKAASKSNPLTVSKMASILRKTFKDRDPDSMANTAGQQLRAHLKNKGWNVLRTETDDGEKGYYLGKKPAESSSAPAKKTPAKKTAPAKKSAPVKKKKSSK